MDIFKKIAKNFRGSEHNYQDPNVNAHCTEFEINNWVVSDFIVNCLVPTVGVHPFPLNELQLMVSTVCRFQPTHIFEWGTNIGKSARIFYATSNRFQLNAEIHSIDLPDDIDHVEHPKSDRGKMVKGIREVHLHTGDGLDTSFAIYQKISGEKNILFYLDGDHSYESVYRELEFITNNIPNANILLHDTFYQSAQSGYNIGPYNAIQDIIHTIPNNYSIISTQTGLPGMTLLYNM